jgi:hypothetical protein
MLNHIGKGALSRAGKRCQMTADFRSNGTRGLNESWDGAGQEPRLADLLADPVVHLVMGRDGLVRSDVEAAIARGQSALRRRLCGAALCCAA